MPYKHVFGPVKGIMTNESPTAIAREATPYCKGVYMKNSEVCSDYGYTEYPVASGTMTNFLSGSIMRVDQFYTLEGLSWLLAITTKNIYQLNTSTTTWDCITPGITLDDCEDAWTQVDAACTVTADTAIKLRGSKSAKMAMSAAAATGDQAYEDTGAKDMSAYTHVHFWIYSTVALAAGDFGFKICEDATAAETNTWAEWAIPAVAASTWTPICIELLLADVLNSAAYTDYTDLNSVDSIALTQVVDKGALDIYIDDVRAVKAFTGDEDNRYSTCTMNDTFVFTNGVDQPGKITEAGGTLTVADLTTTLATGTISTAELAFSFKDHLFLMSNTENAADAPQRVSWTNIGAIEDWTVGTAGYQDLYDDESWIIAVEGLSENEVVIYKERSIVIMMWVGGHTPFRFYTMVSGSGALSKESVTNVGGEHVVMGPDLIYAYKGEKSTDAMDDNVKDTMYPVLDRENAGRVFLMYVEEDDELQAWIPTTTAYPDDVWCMNMVKENWYRKTRTMTGFGYYQESSSLTIGDLTGTIGEQNWRFGEMLTKAYTPITLVGDHNGKVYKLDKMTLNNDGTAIVNEFQTPDFVLPGTEYYMNKSMRVSQLIFEAKGQSITTHWSDDGGASWSPTEGAGGNVTALSSTHKDYQQDFDCVVKKIRFRFRNETASSGYKFRHYGFRWEVRSGRR